MNDLDRRVTIVTELPANAVNALRAGDILRVTRKSVHEERSTPSNPKGTYRIVLEVERQNR